MASDHGGGEGGATDTRPGLARSASVRLSRRLSKRRRAGAFGPESMGLRREPLLWDRGSLRIYVAAAALSLCALIILS